MIRPPSKRGRRKRTHPSVRRGRLLGQGASTRAARAAPAPIDEGRPDGRRRYRPSRTPKAGRPRLKIRFRRRSARAGPPQSRHSPVPWTLPRRSRSRRGRRRWRNLQMARRQRSRRPAPEHTPQATRSRGRSPTELESSIVTQANSEPVEIRLICWAVCQTAPRSMPSAPATSLRALRPRWPLPRTVPRAERPCYGECAE